MISEEARNKIKAARADVSFAIYKLVQARLLIPEGIGEVGLRADLEQWAQTLQKFNDEAEVIS